MIRGVLESLVLSVSGFGEEVRPLEAGEAEVSGGEAVRPPEAEAVLGVRAELL